MVASDCPADKYVPRHRHHVQLAQAGLSCRRAMTLIWLAFDDAGGVWLLHGVEQQMEIRPPLE